MYTISQSVTQTVTQMCHRQ